MMNAQEYNLTETYERLMDSCTPQNFCAFLSCCFLIEDGCSLRSDQLNRLIYTEGDQNEVYTQDERNFIKEFQSEVGVYSFAKQARHKSVPCRIISTHITDSSEQLYDSIKFMKIFNKAFSGFNIFLFVGSLGVFFGSSCIQTNDLNMDCIISPCITRKCNWEAIYNNLLYRDEDTDFYNYYFGIIDLIYSFRDCFSSDYDTNYDSFYLDNYADDDDDPADRVSKTIVQKGYSIFHSIEGSEAISEDLKANFDPYEFDEDVSDCMRSLNYIKTNRVNPLEILIDAEMAYLQGQSTEQELDARNMTMGNESNMSSIDQANLKLLSDPIALMKKLKKERGL